MSSPSWDFCGTREILFIQPRPVRHRRAGLVDDDAVGATQMGAHLLDDWHQGEASATRPTAERAEPLEGAGLSAEAQAFAEFETMNRAISGSVGSPPSITC